MARHIFSDTDINYIIEQHFISKRPIKDICREFRVNYRVIKRVIVDSGRIPLNFYKWHYGVYCLKCAISLYEYGIGLRGIANRLDVSLSTLTSEFKRQGIHIRTQSEQETAKWAIMDKHQRAEQVRKAHEATLGKSPTIETLEKRAKTIEETKSTPFSEYEKLILEDLPFTNIITQKAIGKYNIDFTIGNIAVEIFGGHWHRYKVAHHLPRCKKIFESGYSIIFIYIDKSTNITFIKNQLITLLDELSGDKSSLSQYRVIWGTLQLITAGTSEDIERAFISPTCNHRNIRTGRYESVSREAIKM